MFFQGSDQWYLFISVLWKVLLLHYSFLAIAFKKKKKQHLRLLYLILYTAFVSLYLNHFRVAVDHSWVWPLCIKQNSYPSE